jgi:hypothetical protein
MPDPTRLLRTLRQAIQAFRATPGRSGRLVSLQNADEVMAVGDLHGNVENFRKVLHRAELAQHANRHLVLQELVHGPHRYPAGGDKSHQLVDLVAALKCQFPNQVHLLLGNHELSQWTAQAIAKADNDLNASFREGVGTAYGAGARDIYAAYLDLFAVIPLAVRTGNRVFLSHSLPGRTRLANFDAARLEREAYDAEDLRPGGTIHSLVWGRDTRLETAAAFLDKVDADWLISGHIPCVCGFETPNNRQIILDALGSPACYCLFPARRAVTHDELVSSIVTF